jgi:hypothetical protein
MVIIGVLSGLVLVGGVFAALRNLGSSSGKRNDRSHII